MAQYQARSCVDCVRTTVYRTGRQPLWEIANIGTYRCQITRRKGSCIVMPKLSLDLNIALVDMTCRCFPRVVVPLHAPDDNRGKDSQHSDDGDELDQRECRWVIILFHKFRFPLTKPLAV